MDCTGRKGTKEALEEENSCPSNRKGAKADARGAKTKGAQSGNFDRASSATEKAHSSVLTGATPAAFVTQISEDRFVTAIDITMFVQQFLCR
jgi:hypothetical protein